MGWGSLLCPLYFAKLGLLPQTVLKKLMSEKVMYCTSLRRRKVTASVQGGVVREPL